MVNKKVVKKNKKVTEIKPVNDSNEEKSGSIFVGVLFLGIGLGFISGHLVGGVLIGLGLAFLADYYFKNYKKK